MLTRTNQRGGEIVRQLGELDVVVSDVRLISPERPVAVVTICNVRGLEFTHVSFLDIKAGVLPQSYLLKEVPRRG